MRKAHRAGLVLVAMLAMVCGAQAAPPAVTLPFERYRLPNGLEVILSADHTAPLVAVNVWYHVGSGDEVPGKSGFAHLFEHMMFQGTKNTGEDAHFPILQAIGASDVNGTTNSDRTNYFEVVPAHQLETALWLESDRMGFLLDALTEASFRNQVDVVRNERRQRYDNVPYGAARFLVAQALYPEGHPYRYLTIGRHEDLEAATLDDVRAFFRQWYSPANATLAVAGDIDIPATRALIEKWFGTLSGGARPAPRAMPTPALTETKQLTAIDSHAKLTRVQRTWLGPKMLADDAEALDAVMEILTAEGWGRLTRRLVIGEGMCTTVQGYFDGRGLSGELVITAQLKPTARPADVEKIIDEEIARMIQQPVTRAELDRVIVGTESAFVWGLEELGERADQLQFFNHYTGDPGYTATYLERVGALTPDALQEAAKRWLSRPYVGMLSIPVKVKAGPPAAEDER